MTAVVSNFSLKEVGSVLVTSNSNVGIGTTSPSYKFHVSNNTNGFISRFTGGASSDVNIGIFGYTGLFGSIGTESNHPLNIFTNGTDKVTITSDGNVGIGTTSPAAKLYVVSSGSPIARFDGSSVASSGATEIDVLGPQSNGDLNLGIGGSTFTDATNNIQNKAFITAATGLSGLNLRSDSGYVQITTGGITSANERMRITSDGNVGIGTTSPISKLNLYGSGSNLSVFKADGSSGTLFEVTDNLSGSLFSVNTIAGLPVLEVFSDNTIVAGTYGSNVLVITGSNVGIGTSSPLAKLHVTGSSSVHAAILMGNVGVGTTTPFGTNANRTVLSVNGTTDVSLNIGSGGSQRAYLYGASSYAELGTIGSLPLTFAPNNSEKMRLDVNGNVGIGSSSPAVKLDVVGDIRTSTGILFGTDTAAANLLDDYEEGTWTGTVTGGTFTNLTIGRYTKIGRQVFASINPNTTAITGNLVISGLPFTAGSRSAMIGTGLPPAGVTYKPIFVDGATIVVDVSGTYAGSSVSTYFACTYEV
jgi:hypothetical protein